MDARNFFDGSTKTPLRLNQYGGSVGGAIKKNKLFFFVAQENLRQVAGQNLIASVPSLAARARATNPAVLPLLNAFPIPDQALPDNPDLGLSHVLAKAPSTNTSAARSSTTT
ncbi:MAG: hypothetical protein WDO18_16280 [Acidobacteriota bacterium]